MPQHFDTKAEDEKLALLRQKEQEDLAKIVAERRGLSYTDFSVVPVNMEALRLIPEERARATSVVAFAQAGKTLSIATDNPENPAALEVFDELERRGFTLEKFLVSQASLAKAFSRYQELSYASVSAAGVFDVSAPEFQSLSEKLGSIGALQAYLSETLVSKKSGRTSHLLEEIILAALTMKASDIHFEPEEETVRLRLRVDGLLADAFSFDPKSYHFINSRVKLLSGLKLNVDSRAQDGRFTINIGGTEIEVRTSVIPGNYGESVVLRLLDPNTLERSTERMGIHPKLRERLEREMRRPNGMLLTTGPTGSGKTTTLYAFLRELHTPDVKIVTIEDPVEYHLPGIVQTQTDGKEYTFASGLRSILRQDPDIILVGEIRDKEVAETAIQAAMTGHFVFSTLHTNNAAGTFPRLVDLGVDPKVFASAITVAMAQRLVRSLNPETRKARPATDVEKRMMQAAFEGITDTTLMPASFDTVYDAVPDEHGTGYKGRTGLYEAIFMDDELGEFLRTSPSENDIRKHVMRQGFVTLAQDGVLKALAGETTLEELLRVVDLPR